jgi:hypothetical protein
MANEHVQGAPALVWFLEGNPRLGSNAQTVMQDVPLDRAILNISLTLTSVSEMHDRQITATALHLARAGSRVPLLTCDANITFSGLVPGVW